jgi:6-pyruvoyltetrahydropterin/6-carboxytetrahydropterin synthase
MNTKTTCSKEYKDFPFAHRQPAHGGHCRFIHGHNWGFTFVFGCSKKDECGFVVDFGNLGVLKDWLTQMFDHTTVLNVDDPLIPRFIGDSVGALSGVDLYDLRLVPDCSCEGLAEYVFQQANEVLRKEFGGRVFIVSVTVSEDSKNFATCAERQE